jgi:hypothetical protein
MENSVTYYFTVYKNDVAERVREPFDDYEAAMAACSSYFRARARRTVLSFTSELVNGKFARSYASLALAREVSQENSFDAGVYADAVKTMNAFDYDAAYLFLIESEFGVADCDAMQTLHEEDDDDQESR